MAIEIIMLHEVETVESGEPAVLDEAPVCCPACRSNLFKKNGRAAAPAAGRAGATGA